MPQRKATIYLIIVDFIATGFILEQPFFFNLALLFIFLVLISYLWGIISLRGLHLKRITSSLQCQVGQDIVEVMHLYNATWLPKLWIEIEDHSTLSAHQANMNMVIPFIAPHDTFTWQLKTPCDVRGEYLLGPLIISTIDPFGIFVISRKIQQTAKFIVYPNAVKIDRLSLPQSTLSGGARRNHPAHNITTNAVSVREYRQGDSFRSIHWSSSAKRDMLMVKEFELDLTKEVWLIVDFEVDFTQQDASRTTHSHRSGIINDRLQDFSIAEYIVVIATSLTQYFASQQYSMGYIAYDTDYILHPPDRQSQLQRRIRHHLATIQHTAEVGLAEILATQTHLLRRGAPVVILTSNVDSAWVTEAIALKRRGFLPFCVLVEPQSFRSQQTIATNEYQLHSAKIPTITVRYGDNLKHTLSQKPRLL